MHLLNGEKPVLCPSEKKRSWERPSVSLAVTHDEEIHFQIHMRIIKKWLQMHRLKDCRCIGLRESVP